MSKTLHTRPGCHQPPHHGPSDSDPQLQPRSCSVALRHSQYGTRGCNGLQLHLIWNLSPAPPQTPSTPPVKPRTTSTAPPRKPSGVPADWALVPGVMWRQTPVSGSSCPALTMCWAAFVESQLFVQCNLVHNGLPGVPDGTQHSGLPPVFPELWYRRCHSASYSPSAGRSITQPLKPQL